MAIEAGVSGIIAFSVLLLSFRVASTIATSHEGSQLHIWLIVFRECNDSDILQSQHTDSLSSTMCIYPAVSMVTHIATSPWCYCMYHTFYQTQTLGEICDVIIIFMYSI